MRDKFKGAKCSDVKWRKRSKDAAVTRARMKAMPEFGPRPTLARTYKEWRGGQEVTVNVYESIPCCEV